VPVSTLIVPLPPIRLIEAPPLPANVYPSVLKFNPDTVRASPLGMLTVPAVPQKIALSLLASFHNWSLTALAPSHQLMLVWLSHVPVPPSPAPVPTSLLVASASESQ